MPSVWWKINLFNFRWIWSSTLSQIIWCLQIISGVWILSGVWKLSLVSANYLVSANHLWCLEIIWCKLSLVSGGRCSFPPPLCLWATGWMVSFDWVVFGEKRKNDLIDWMRGQSASSRLHRQRGPLRDTRGPTSRAKLPVRNLKKKQVLDENRKISKKVIHKSKRGTTRWGEENNCSK